VAAYETGPENEAVNVLAVEIELVIEPIIHSIRRCHLSHGSVVGGQEVLQRTPHNQADATNPSR
jgi:hypothetical protein